MATRAELIRAVKVKLEEFSNFENNSFVLPPDELKKPVESYIEETLDEAARQLLLTLPQWVLKPYITEYDTFVSVVSDEAHRFYGVVSVPNDFLRLVGIRVRGWQRECNEHFGFISSSDVRYKEQRNPFVRGDKAKPVAVLVAGGAIELYGVPALIGVELDYFRYIPDIDYLDEARGKRFTEYLVLETAIRVAGIYDNINKVKILQEQRDMMLKTDLQV